MATNVRNYIAYFQKLANEHKDIMDFYIMDINETLKSLRGDFQFPALILNSLTGQLNGPNLDDTIDEVRGGFWIVGRLENLDDFSGEMLLLEQMKQIGTDIISRMMNDVLKCEPMAEKAIPGFDFRTVQYEMLEGLLENDFGFLFSFTIQTEIDLRYDPEKWDAEKVIAGKFAY